VWQECRCVWEFGSAHGAAFAMDDDAQGESQGCLGAVQHAAGEPHKLTGQMPGSLQLCSAPACTAIVTAEGLSSHVLHCAFARSLRVTTAGQISDIAIDAHDCDAKKREENVHPQELNVYDFVDHDRDYLARSGLKRGRIASAATWRDGEAKLRATETAELRFLAMDGGVESICQTEIDILSLKTVPTSTYSKHRSICPVESCGTEILTRNFAQHFAKRNHPQLDPHCSNALMKVARTATSCYRRVASSLVKEPEHVGNAVKPVMKQRVLPTQMHKAGESRETTVEANAMVRRTSKRVLNKPRVGGNRAYGPEDFEFTDYLGGSDDDGRALDKDTNDEEYVVADESDDDEELYLSSKMCKRSRQERPKPRHQQRYGPMAGELKCENAKANRAALQLQAERFLLARDGGVEGLCRAEIDLLGLKTVPDSSYGKHRAVCPVCGLETATRKFSQHVLKRGHAQLPQLQHDALMKIARVADACYGRIRVFILRALDTDRDVMVTEEGLQNGGQNCSVENISDTGGGEPEASESSFKHDRETKKVKFRRLDSVANSRARPLFGELGYFSMRCPARCCRRTFLKSMVMDHVLSSSKCYDEVSSNGPMYNALTALCRRAESYEKRMEDIAMGRLPKPNFAGKACEEDPAASSIAADVAMITPLTCGSPSASRTSAAVCKDATKSIACDLTIFGTSAVSSIAADSAVVAYTTDPRKDSIFDTTSDQEVLRDKMVAMNSVKPEGRKKEAASFSSAPVGPPETQFGDDNVGFCNSSVHVDPSCAKIVIVDETRSSKALPALSLVVGEEVWKCPVLECGVEMEWLLLPKHMKGIGCMKGATLTELEENAVLDVRRRVEEKFDKARKSYAE
jgi:hypothetical protein